jgi:hypothetical protein
MARRKKNNNTAVSFNEDATIKKLTSQLVDPRVQNWLWGGAQGVRERILQLNFETLRRSVGQLPLINGIINTRQDQILPFLKYATEQNDRGFRFEIENRTEEFRGEKENESEIIQLTNFIEQTGFVFDGEREDDFMDYISMLVRDTYEIDQIATEIQYNRMGEPVAFWALDGATISRVTDEKRWGKDIRFVQKIDDKIYEEYKSENLIFDYKFKRSDVKYRGYGYSPVEMCINIITTLLFGYNYIRDQLIKDRVPKGFISVMGDVAKPQLDSIRNYWYAAMTGAGAQFNIPILPSGKDGVGIDFKNLSSNNKDMEYHKTMMFISSLVGAVFSMDLAELGIKTDDSTSIISENAEPRIQSSKDRGLASMLGFAEQHVNKVIRKVTKKYRFKFVGLEREDEQKKAEVRNKQIMGWRSIDEVRVEDGDEPYNEDWSKMPMNAQAVQIFLAGKAQEQQAAMQEQGMGDYGDLGEGQYSESSNADEEDAGEKEVNSTRTEKDEVRAEKSLKELRSLTKSKERTLRIVVE